MNKIMRINTKKWVVAFTYYNHDWIYLLDKNNLEKESYHKYSKETYAARIKHELAHLFS